MPVTPIHPVIPQSDFGIFLKEVSPSLTNQFVKYAHRDSYYLFGLVDSGKCCVSIDFNDYCLSEGQMISTQPNQVHRIVDRGNAKAFLLFVDSVFIDDRSKQILAEFALSPVSFGISEVQRSELKQLFAIILRRINNPGGEESKHILQKLSIAAVGIITEAIQGIIRQQSKNKRHLEITLAFKDLLSKEKHTGKKTSDYAERLHLSAVYLNEAVREVTGISAGKYIQNEFMLRAKRMLVYTSLTIKEISFELGFDDYAYFTRLFTKTTGMNPTSYRKKHLG